MTPHKKACFADGGAVSKADQLIAEMNAKYGVSGNAPAPKPATPAPQPQPAAPAPQPGSLIQRAAGIIGGRKEQIDKAVNSYACGGKVKAHAAGGKVKTIKGPGTSTSDSIPAKVKETGEQILVSNGERILSKKQDRLLDKIAKMLGYGSTDELLASGTGRPVGPTMKGGKKAAEDGMTVEEKWRLQQAGQPVPAAPLPANSGRGDTSTPIGKSISDSFANFRAGNPQGTPVVGQQSQSNYSNEGRSVQTPITGPASSPISVPTAPTVAPPQDKSPIVAGMDSKQNYGPVGGNGVNDILARENKARGEMIALSMPQVGGTAPGILGGGSLGTLPGGQSIEEWNRNVGVKTQLGLDPKARVAYEDQVAKNEAQRRGQDLVHEAAMYGHDIQGQRAAGHDSILMRGQDITAQTEAAKLAGSPYDKARAAEAEQLTALRGKFLDPKTPEDEKAKIKEYLSMVSKKGGDGRQTAHVVGVYDSMGNKTGERLAVAPSGAEPSFYDPSAQRGQDKPVPTGYTVAGTSGGKRVLQDAKGNRFLEG